MKYLMLPCLLCLCCMSVVVAAPEAPLHLDRAKLPYACTTCHVAMDFRSGGGSEGCLACHGNRSKIVPGLVAAGAEPHDIEPEIKKTYRHPVLENPGLHSNSETLPETDPRAPRHAVCADCHDVHYVMPGKKFAGIKGKRAGKMFVEVTTEQELCYKCHGESANLPARSTNKRTEFSLSSPSFHPVEGEGRNQMVPSLLRPYKEKKVVATDVSIITCTTCHASDNPDAPRGPHGSNYQYILTENYSTKDGESESFSAYALCYHCHSRSSILGNQSFPMHSHHIAGKGGGTSMLTDGTSCFTCHSSHGSTDYKYLLRFNREVVFPNKRGILKFVEKGNGAFRGECYLSCHGKDHDPANNTGVYPVVQ